MHQPIYILTPSESAKFRKLSNFRGCLINLYFYAIISELLERIYHMVQELYLKYKDRYFEDFFTPEVRDLPKDKKELLLSELETMRKNTAIMENRRKHAEEKDWEDEAEEWGRARRNAFQRGVMAANLILDLHHKTMLDVREVSEILDGYCFAARQRESDLYTILSRHKSWEYRHNYQVSESGKVFYEQCMRDYCNPQKRDKFLSIVNATPAVKLATKQLSSLQASNQGIER